MRPTFMEDVVQSIIKWGQNFIEDSEIKNIAIDPIEYWVWDAYGDVTDLPDVPLFGHSGFAMDTDGLMGAANFSYGLSFIQDKNLNRHTKIMSRLFSQLTPGRQIPFIDGQDPTLGYESWMIITDDTNLLPVVRTPIRPVQFIQVTVEVNPYLLDHTIEDLSP